MTSGHPKLSPRMRGCFCRDTTQRRNAYAFPAYAGMFRSIDVMDTGRAGFPRVCGDVSMKLTKNRFTRWLSPRMRGCFCQESRGCGSVEAFPAYAGMFLNKERPKDDRDSFPRVCGDVSPPAPAYITDAQLSPRMRGCFCTCHGGVLLGVAFPAYAGMFPSESEKSSHA